MERRLTQTDKVQYNVTEEVKMLLAIALTGFALVYEESILHQLATWKIVPLNILPMLDDEPNITLLWRMASALLISELLVLIPSLVEYRKAMQELDSEATYIQQLNQVLEQSLPTVEDIINALHEVLLVVGVLWIVCTVMVFIGILEINSFDFLLASNVHVLHYLLHFIVNGTWMDVVLIILATLLYSRFLIYAYNVFNTRLQEKAAYDRREQQSRRRRLH